MLQAQRSAERDERPSQAVMIGLIELTSCSVPCPILIVFLFYFRFGTRLNIFNIAFALLHLRVSKNATAVILVSLATFLLLTSFSCMFKAFLWFELPIFLVFVVGWYEF